MAFANQLETYETCLPNNNKINCAKCKQKVPLPCISLSLSVPFSLLPPSKLPTRVNCHLCLYFCCLPTDFAFVFACLPCLLLLPSFFFPLPWSPCSCYAFIAIVVAAPAVMLIIYIARAQHELRNCRTVCAVPLSPPLLPLFPLSTPNRTPFPFPAAACVGAKEFDLPAAISWSVRSGLSICCCCCSLLLLLLFIKTQWAVRDKRKRWIHSKHRYDKANININMQINTYHMSEEYHSTHSFSLSVM